MEACLLRTVRTYATDIAFVMIFFAKYDYKYMFYIVLVVLFFSFNKHFDDFVALLSLSVNLWLLLLATIDNSFIFTLIATCESPWFLLQSRVMVV